MSASRKHIMRQLRLQLKSGYMQKEPAEYTFMKRYPPLHRDSKPSFDKLDRGKVPYVDLYQKVIERNPLYEERVYPAYWQQEPQALVIAKKQYEYMQTGDDEETAFRKAEQYMDGLENEAYLKLKNLHEALEKKGAIPSIVSDQKLAAEIAQWKRRLQDTVYEDLEDFEQGQIDYIIQAKVMKWSEVERERRMKDPIFVLQFEKVRSLVFPEGEDVFKAKISQHRDKLKKQFYEFFEVDASSLHTSAPFYVEDYIYYFQKLQEQPELKQWDLADRSAFTQWVSRTLALRELVYKQPSYKVNRYIHTLSTHFFPMIAHPQRVEEFSIPMTAQDFRDILYANDIGYKTVQLSNEEDLADASMASAGGLEGEKATGADSAEVQKRLYVKRFYKLPALLFPREAFTAGVSSDVEKLE